MARDSSSYTIVPDDLIFDDRLSPNDKFVYTVLSLHADNKSRKCYPTQKRIAEISGLSRGTIIKAVKNLVEYEYISVDKKVKGTKTFNEYRILDEDIIEKNRKNSDTLKSDTNSDTSTRGTTVKHREVQQLNPNYTNTNYIKNNNTLSKDKVCGKNTASQKQRTLFNVPNHLEKPKRRNKSTHREIGLEKIRLAKQNLIPWKDVTFRDFTYYYIEQHNSKMERNIQFNMYESVGVIRDSLIKSFNIPKSEVCGYIDRLLDIYSSSPQSWGYLSFNMIKSNYPMMKDLMMRVRLEIEEQKEPKVDEKLQKQIDEWRWKIQNIDKLPEGEVF